MDLTGLGPIANFAGKIVDKLSAYFPDPAQKAAALLEIQKLQQTGELAQLASDTQLAQGQIDINKIEAASTNWYIAGARPFILWTCGFALAYVSIFDPMARFVSTVMFHYAGAFPIIDTTITMQVLLGLLGLSGMRTYEKRTGTEGNR